MNKPNFLMNENLIVTSVGKDSSFVDVEKLMAVVWRQLKVVLVCILIGIVLGVLYLRTTPHTYQASTDILLDEGLNKIVDETSATPLNIQTDSAILSQIEILKSTRLALAVVDKMNLAGNPAFFATPPSVIGRGINAIRGLLAGFRPADADKADGISPETMQYAALVLQRRLFVERVGRSYVISVGYESYDPALATAIVQAYADAYLSDQLNANFDATERATVWLQDRIVALKKNSSDASMEAARYRADNGLTASNGALISEQQIADLNVQLVNAQADTARAHARYEQYQAIVAAGSEKAIENGTIFSDQQNNSTIGELKTRYLALTARLQEITKKFGPDHPQAAALRTEQQNLVGQIYEELRQLATSYRNEYQAALSREMSLQTQIGQLTGRNATDNQSMVHLRELEQRADALSTLYQTFLGRYEEAAQQQSFPISKVRVISDASFPLAPATPRGSVVMAFSLLLGLVTGCAFAALNEFRERFFRLGDEIRSELGLKFLGYLPFIADNRERPARAALGKSPTPAANKAPVRLARSLTGLMRVAVDAPASSFAETLRNARIGSDIVLQRARGKVLGITSVLPNEGKSTVAANFASLLASNGARTLLIDGDMRNPGLSRALKATTGQGLVEAILGNAPWQSLLMVDPETGLAILPAVLRTQFAHTSEMLTSPGMRELLESAKSIFEYIIVDLPPLGPVVDAKAFEPMVDGFLMITKWGSTPRALVRSIMQSEPQVAAKVVGVILNQTDLKRLSRYGSFGSSESFIKKYQVYYGEGKTSGL